MFMKVMTAHGFLIIWMIYFLGYVFYLNGLVKHRQSNKVVLNFDSFIFRIYSIFFMNVVTGILIVIVPAVLIMLNIHWYWILTGIISSLVMYAFLLYMIKFSEKLLNRKPNKLEQDLANKMTLDNINKEKKKTEILFWVVFIINIFGYILLPLNAWEIIPITKMFLPPIMPLYFHMLMDIVQMIGIMLLNFLLLIVSSKRMKWVYVSYIKRGRHVVLEEDEEEGTENNNN